MKMNTKLFAILGVAALAATTAVAKPSGETVHFSIHTTLTDTGVEPGSAGTVSANQVNQGSKTNQKLDVSVSGLTANTDYTLTANTTGSGTVTLDPFTTDNNGKAKLHLSNGNGGKNTVALPDGFDFTQVTEFDVSNGSTAVLTTSGTTPKTLQYTVKKDISTNGITGTLQITANTKNTKFNLNASGLSPDTDYNLFFNGTQVQTNTTDSKGRLKIKSAPTPDNILDLNAVEVQDTLGTPVLSTTVP
jgi:hypothetical protein